MWPPSWSAPRVLRWGAGRLRRLVLSKRAAPADDLLSYLTDGALTDDEVTFMGITLLVAGHETTANMLSLGVFTLLEHPDQLARLLADPSLAEHAVEELMRHQTIIHAGPTRAALEDVELAGEVIRAGEAVTVSLVAANRDAHRFPDPDTLDLANPAAQGQLGFGFGIHQCTGQQLARLEMQIALKELFRRFPGLRLARPARDIEMRDTMSIYDVGHLPLLLGAEQGRTAAPQRAATVTMSPMISSVTFRDLLNASPAREKAEAGLAPPMRAAKPTTAANRADARRAKQIPKSRVIIAVLMEDSFSSIGSVRKPVRTSAAASGPPRQPLLASPDRTCRSGRLL